MASSSKPYEGSPPEFGHAMHKYFGFDPRYTNLNHGSYGSLPLPVKAACDELTTRIEANPDLFIRRVYQRPLVRVRERIADLIGAEPDECVMVPNTSHGLNTVLHNFCWNEGDIILRTSTTYESISRTIQYLADRPPHPSISTFKLCFPKSPKAIVAEFRAHIRAIQRDLKSAACPRKIVTIIDSIVALPGVLMPWKEMIRVCREESVWTVIDAAHSIGQELGINLREAQPDFWVSNCHKWLFAKRTCAVLYVPRRNQHIIQSTFPTSYAYISPSDQGTPGRSSFITQFEWNATMDFVPFLSVLSALDFRRWLGGEVKINTYCHSLAVRGGRHLANMLGTRAMDEFEEMIANMVNVELPIPGSIVWSVDVDEIFRRRLLEEMNVYASHFYHNSRWWVRCSAQIWNEIQDFVTLGLALIPICAEIRERFGKTSESAARL